VSSDSARHYAAEFDRDYGPGTIWSVLGDAGLTTVVAYLYKRSDRSSAGWRDEDWGLLGGFVVSFGMSVYGHHRLERAQRGAARAILWHNRELVATR
jgi:hypothetical protein